MNAHTNTLVSFQAVRRMDNKSEKTSTGGDDTSLEKPEDQDSKQEVPESKPEVEERGAWGGQTSRDFSPRLNTSQKAFLANNGHMRGFAHK